MISTARRIQEVIEKKNTVFLRFSEGRPVRLSKDAYYEREDLLPGAEVDWESFTEWLMPRQYQEALHYAVDLLARKARCSGEITQKLIDRFYLAETAEMVVYKLEKERLLDDAAYLRMYVAERSRFSIGPGRIRAELKRKGFQNDEIDAALSELPGNDISEPALELAQKLLRKYAGEDDPRKAYQKELAAMARRGYGYEDSKKALGKARSLLREK